MIDSDVEVEKIQEKGRFHGVVAMVWGASIAIGYMSGIYAQAGNTQQYADKSYDSRKIPSNNYRDGTARDGSMWGKSVSGGLVPTAEGGKFISSRVNPRATAGQFVEVKKAFLQKDPSVPCVNMGSTIKPNSPFGWRWHPTHFFWRVHDGLDFPLGSGTALYAPFDGSISMLSSSEGGNVAVISSSDGYYQATYMHLSGYATSGGQVKKGDLFARSGNTGSASTGAHLHFKLRYRPPNSGSLVPVDPQNFICGLSGGTPVDYPEGSAAPNGNAYPDNTEGQNRRPEAHSGTKTDPQGDGAGDGTDESSIENEKLDQCPLIPLNETQFVTVEAGQPPIEMPPDTGAPSPNPSNTGASKNLIQNSIMTAQNFKAGNILGLDSAHTRALVASVVATESSGGVLSAANRKGYFGRYQAGPSWLSDAGLIKGGSSAVASAIKKAGYKKEWEWGVSGGAKKFLDNPANWNNGLTLSAYLASAEIQDAAFKVVNDKIYARLYASGLPSDTTMRQLAGLLKAAHIGGLGGARSVMQGGGDVADSNGTSSKMYYYDVVNDRHGFLRYFQKN